MFDKKEYKLSSDGRYIYRYYCDQCGKKLSFTRLSNKKHICVSCTAKNNNNIKNLQTKIVREKANISHRKYKDLIDYSDRKQTSSGLYLYRQLCSRCGRNRGYQISNYVNKVCRECYEKGRKRNSIHYHIKKNISSNIYHRLENRLINKNRRESFKFLNFTISELKLHLESKFLPGMSWDNYGEWHIDHVVPDSWFNYKDMEDESFRKSWSLDNLQPLWHKENIQKSDYFIDSNNKKLSLEEYKLLNPNMSIFLK